MAGTSERVALGFPGVEVRKSQTTQPDIHPAALYVQVGLCSLVRRLLIV